MICQSEQPVKSDSFDQLKPIDSSIPSSLKELETKYTSVLDFQDISNDLVEQIGKEIIRLTTSWQNKSINTLNKQFQNSVMNYFLECYVSELLVEDFKVEFKRDVFKALTAKMEQEEGANLKKRYITLLNYFLESLDSHNKINGYINLLLNLILDPIATEIDTIDYQTQYRKKMTALLLLEHSIHSDRKTKFTDFYSLWTHVFTFSPLKRKKSKTLSQGKSPKKVLIAKAISSTCVATSIIPNNLQIIFNTKRKNTASSAMTDLPAAPKVQFDNLSQSSQPRKSKKTESADIRHEQPLVETAKTGFQSSVPSSPLPSSSQLPSSSTQLSAQLSQTAYIMQQQQQQQLQLQQQQQQLQMHQQQQDLFNYYCLQQYQLQQQQMQFQQNQSLLQLLAQKATGQSFQFLQVQVQQPQLQQQQFSPNQIPTRQFSSYPQNPFYLY